MILTSRTGAPRDRDDDGFLDDPKRTRMDSTDGATTAVTLNELSRGGSQHSGLLSITRQARCGCRLVVQEVVKSTPARQSVPTPCMAHVPFWLPIQGGCARETDGPAAAFPAASRIVCPQWGSDGPTDRSSRRQRGHVSANTFLLRTPIAPLPPIDSLGPVAAGNSWFRSERTTC